MSLVDSVCKQESNEMPTAIPTFFGILLSNKNIGNVRLNGNNQKWNPRWRPLNVKYVIFQRETGKSKRATTESILFCVAYYSRPIYVILRTLRTRLYTKRLAWLTAPE